ncbi:helix-turn-helix transcriptional regulator [bacterium]|nr:helix-turn-helix transcriptional regulator [bacterium]
MKRYRNQGDTIREYREDIGMNITELATKIGIPEKHLSEIERNERPLTLGIIQQLYKYLDIDPVIIGCHLNIKDFGKLVEEKNSKLTDDIGDRIKAVRETNNVTQKDFAHLMNTNQRTVSHWENGRNDPNIDNIANIVLQYRVDPYWLLFGDQEVVEVLKAHEENYAQYELKSEQPIVTKNALHSEICDLLDNASEKFLINLKNKLLELKHINESN